MCLPPKQIVLNDRVDRPDPIPPSNLFSFFVSSTVIGDSDFEEPTTGLSYLGRNFRFKAEPIFFDRDAGQDFAAKRFVACLHVGQVHVGQHVGQQGKKAIADHVPKIDHSVGATTQEAGTVNHVCLIGPDWIQEKIVFLRIVFQVRILNDDYVSASRREPGP